MKKLLVLAILLISSLGAVHAQSGPANWTIMHYTAVDNNLEGAAFNDYYEMQSVGSGNGVNIVTQLDRAVGFEARFGDWTDTRRFFMEYVPAPPPADIDGMRAAVVDWAVAQNLGTAEELTAQAAQLSDELAQQIYAANNLDATFDQTPVAELGEVDMGDPQALFDFIGWAVTTYPAEHYMLVIGSHGGGWRGIGPDDGSAEPSMLELPEIVAALAAAQEALGVDRFDIVGFDACLMGVTDVAVALEPFADYVLFSQEVIPSNGWEYFNSITAMQQNPDWDAFQVGAAFVDTYMDYYAGPGERTKVGLSLVETVGLPNLLASLSDFSAVVGTDTAALLSALGTARNNSQIFGASLGDRADIYSYVDLRDFMNWFSLQTSITEDAYSAAQAVIAAYDSTVVYSRADSFLPGGNGLAIYLPSGPLTYDPTYPAAAPADFALWQSYLDQFYQTIVSELDGSALQLEVTSIFSMSDTPSLLDNPVVFFNAAGLGVVDLSYVIYYQNDDGSQVIVDYSPISYTTTLPTGETVKEYPNELTPSTFAWSVEFPVITDGTNSVLSLLQSTAGSGNEMTVSGTYVTAQGAQPATLIFSSETQAYIGILASDGTTVYQPSPSPGDQFIVDLLMIAADGTVTAQPQTNTPLTFGLQPFTFHYEAAPSGNYRITLRIADLAGNTTQTSADVSINNEGVNTNLRGYTDTNEGVYFQYPRAWGESYSFTNDDGSLTNALSDETQTQGIFVDVYLETDAASTLDAVLATVDGEVSDISETTIGGLPALVASYTTLIDDVPSTSYVVSVDNEPAASVVVITFTAWGDDMQPDADVLSLVDQTLHFFPPILD
ncbi:MAG: hypothetical protein J0M07_11190 [Anaerolineae bacterium]|nr:hypothetical protein [Anaerolineae bacterium]